MGPKLRHCCAVLSCFSHVQLFVTLWTVACQAPLSMGFSRQEYWSGLLCPSPGELPDPGIKPASLVSLALQADSLPTEPPGKSKLRQYFYLIRIFKNCYKILTISTFPFWFQIQLIISFACPPLYSLICPFKYRHVVYCTKNAYIYHLSLQETA